MSLSGVAVSGRPNSFHTSARDQAATAVVVVAEKKEENDCSARSIEGSFMFHRPADGFVNQPTEKLRYYLAQAFCFALVQFIFTCMG